jgi:hypothetical protein
LVGTRGAIGGRAAQGAGARAAVTPLVADAIVALKWFPLERPDEGDTGPALALLRGVASGLVQLVQPPHFVAEVAAALARESTRTAQRDLGRLMALPVRTVGAPEHYALAMDLSARHKQHLFHTLYHAPALSVPGATLVTADARYEAKVRGEGRITLLRSLTLPA